MSPPLTIECRDCGAAVTLEAHQKSATCAYCASPSVVSRPVTRDRPTPRFALGFIVTKERALALATRWVSRAYWAPEAFRRSSVSEIRGLYLPAYLYSAAAHASFSVSIGEDYEVTETYTEKDSEGKTVTRTRTRTETEWRPLSGVHSSYVSDRVVTASRGIPNVELEAVEPFDLRALCRYTPTIISGWPAEDPSLGLAECAKLARQEALAQVGRRLSGFMPGDRHSGLTYRTRLEQEDLTLALLPIWVLPVRYRADRPPVRLLINGQTGAITGRAPRSWLKISVASALGAAAAAGLLLVLARWLGLWS